MKGGRAVRLPVPSPGIPPDGAGTRVNDEAQWIREALAGNGEGYRQLVLRHQDRVFRILSRHEWDAEVVRELAQDTFLRAWQALDRFDGRVPFEHWLSRIATHVALSRARSRARRPETTWSALDPGAEAGLEQWSADGGIEPPAARELLERALEALSPEERVVLVALELEEQPAREVARRLGWSVVRVRVRAFRARKKLRTALLELEIAHERITPDKTLRLGPVDADCSASG